MSELSAHSNDRSLYRHPINGDIDVYDSLRDIYLGRLVNIHVQGLMLVGDVLLEEDRLYELDMHVPTLEGQKNVLRVGVDCLWTRAADQYGKHWTGFSIIDITPQTLEEIRKIIDIWGAR